MPLTERELCRIQLQMIPAIDEEMKNYVDSGVLAAEVKGKKAIELFVKITKKLLVKEEFTNFHCRKYILLLSIIFHISKAVAIFFARLASDVFPKIFLEYF